MIANGLANGTNENEVVDYIFSELSYLYPGSHKQFKGADILSRTKSIWGKALKDSNVVSISQAKRGLEKCAIESQFFPTPAKFIELCTPKAYEVGAPSLEDVMIRIVQHGNPNGLSDMHVVTYNVFKRVQRGIYDLKQASRDKVLRDLKPHYEEVLDNFLHHGKLDPVPLQIEDLSDKPPKHNEDTESGKSERSISIADHHMTMMRADIATWK